MSITIYVHPSQNDKLKTFINCSCNVCARDFRYNCRTIRHVVSYRAFFYTLYVDLFSMNFKILL